MLHTAFMVAAWSALCTLCALGISLTLGKRVFKYKLFEIRSTNNLKSLGLGYFGGVLNYDSKNTVVRLVEQLPWNKRGVANRWADAIFPDCVNNPRRNWGCWRGKGDWCGNSAYYYHSDPDDDGYSVYRAVTKSRTFVGWALTIISMTAASIAVLAMVVVVIYTPWQILLGVISGGIMIAFGAGLLLMLGAM